MAMVYAETSAKRTRQIVGDILLVMWIAVCVSVAAQLHDLLLVFAVPGRELADVGSSLSAGADRVGDAIRGTPLIGERVASPFAALEDAGARLTDVGLETRQAAERLALWLSVAAASGPIAVVALPYLLWRMTWSRRAGVVSRLRTEPRMVELLALRAAANRPLDELERVSDDPVRDLRERPHVLAGLELRSIGLRMAR